MAGLKCSNFENLETTRHWSALGRQGLVPAALSMEGTDLIQQQSKSIWKQEKQTNSLDTFRVQGILPFLTTFPASNLTTYLSPNLSKGV